MKSLTLCLAVLLFASASIDARELLGGKDASFADHFGLFGFKTLSAAIKAAGLDKTLSDPKLEATIFAPTDAAFEKALKALKLTAAQLLADKELLTKVLKYHVVPGKGIKSFDLKKGTTSVKTLEGGSVDVVVKDEHVLLRDITVKGKKDSKGQVVIPNIPYNKIIVHAIDGVLLP